MKEINITVYETEDGKRFYDKEKAEEYEKKFNESTALSEALNKFRIKEKGPQYLPNDTPSLMPKDYDWFYIESEEEYDELNKLLYKMYNGRFHQQFSSSKRDFLKFPTYIYLSHTFNNFGALSILEEEHNRYENKWKYFFSFFNNLDEKRDHGVLEEE